MSADSPTLVILLSAMAAMNALSVEIILPAVVPISRDMSVTEESAAMLIGGYFLAYAIGQMLWGLLSDAFGRRPMLLLGLSGYLAASVGAIFAPDFNTLLMFRLAQGVLGAAPIIAYAIVRDISSGSRAAQTQAVLSAVISLAPLIAPVIGSGLLVLSGWRIIFVFLAGCSLVLITAAYLNLPETIKERRPSRLHPSFMVGRIAELFGDPQFRTGALVMSISFAGFASFLTLGSVVTENVFAIAPEAFGSVYAIVALTMLGGVLLARWLLASRSMQWVGSLGLGLMVLAVLANGLLIFAEPGFPLFWSVMAIYLFAFGIIFPTFTSYALEASGSTPGFAASLVGAMNMSFGFVASLLVTGLYDGSFRAICIVMVLTGALVVGIFGRHILKRR